jgi:hypothetical protein
VDSGSMLMLVWLMVYLNKLVEFIKLSTAKVCDPIPIQTDRARKDS